MLGAILIMTTTCGGAQIASITPIGVAIKISALGLTVGASANAFPVDGQRRENTSVESVMLKQFVEVKCHPNQGEAA